MEPYVHGIGHDGRQILVAFQRAGSSASGHSKGWKAFRIDELSRVEDLKVPFVVNQASYREGGQSKNIAEAHCYV